MVKKGGSALIYGEKITENMKELLEFIIKGIVNKPEEAEIKGDTVKVAAEDMGTVIGREGKIIKSIRELVRVWAVKNNVLANFELLEAERV